MRVRSKILFAASALTNSSSILQEEATVGVGWLETPFVQPSMLNDMQLVYQTIVYAVILFTASGFISSGSELLCLVPAMTNIVGSIVLPILGAVPDGMMVLFSGIGANAQQTISVGVGALAGSTVMLLTIPWFIVIVSGRVPLDKDSGEADYKNKVKDSSPSLLSTGITFGPSITTGTWIMLATTLLYLIIEVPSALTEAAGLSTLSQSIDENLMALVGFLACVGAFVAYMVYCFRASSEDKIVLRMIESINMRQIDLPMALKIIQGTHTPDMLTEEKREEKAEVEKRRLEGVCRPFFNRFDESRSNSLDKSEMKQVLDKLGFSKDEKKRQEQFEKADTTHDSSVSFKEFVAYLHRCMTGEILEAKKAIDAAGDKPTFEKEKTAVVGEEEQEEEEEMPEDLIALSPEAQARSLLYRSSFWMGLGTVIILVFSDSMVGVLNEWGRRLGISPFYISFVVAPFVSNASELLAAYTYAVRRTQRSVTISLSTLVGAACMNNTFVLGIFLILVWLQRLAWQFTAETIAMVLVQWIIAAIIILKGRTQTLITAGLVIACYPLTIAIVYVLETYVGID